MTRLRRSAALVLSLDGPDVVAFNYLRRTRAAVPARGLESLARLGDWRDPAELFDGAPDRAGLAAVLLRMLDDGLLVVEGTAAAAEDERLAREWPWGAMAGHYHFGIKDTQYLGPQAVFQMLVAKVAAAPPVPLYASHVPTVTLPPPDLGDGLLGLMARRRSWRGFDAGPLPLEALRDCLFSGFGILGFAESPVPGEGHLPLTTTPSGGARNPFEAYVVARAVAGLEPGVYHYAGLHNSLSRVGDAPPPPLSSLVGGQAPFDEAGALVLLVATFERSAWKYPHPTGFRVILLEAGHIAQNLLLCATAHGLAATPTCALSDAAVERLLGLDRVRHAALHAVALGSRGPASAADIVAIVPNPYLR